MINLFSKIKTFTTIGCLLTASLVLNADDKDSKTEMSKHKLDEWTFGEVTHGEAFKKSDLKGQVVVIENWGVR